MALSGTFALLLLSLALLLVAHFLPKLFPEVAGRLVAVPGGRVALLGLPLLVGPLLEVLQALVLIAGISAAPLLLLLGEDSGLAGAPLARSVSWPGCLISLTSGWVYFSTLFVIRRLLSRSYTGPVLSPITA